MVDQESPSPSLFSLMMRDGRQRFSELVIYELLFKLLSAAVIAPVLAAILSTLISFSGDDSLSNERIAAFLLSPLGIVTVTLWSVAAYTITLAEQSGLLIIVASSHRGQGKGALASIWFALCRATQLAKLAAMQIAILSLVLLPLVGVAWGVYQFLLSGHDINYYLSQRPPEFIWALAIGGTLATFGVMVFIRIHVGWIFAMPLCLLEGESPRDALKTSRAMVRKRFWRLMKSLSAWLIGTFVFGVILLLIVRFVTNSLVGLAGEQLTVLIPLLAGLSAVHILALAVVSFVSIASYSLLVVHMYRAACEEDERDYARDVHVDDAQPSFLQRYMTRRRFAVATALAAFAIAVLAALGMLATIDVEDSFDVTAHRGSSLRAPENSMAAIELAIEEGADYIEIDVQETADGQIVVWHDKDFMRLANDGRSIWEMNYSDLAELDVGSWFGEEFSDQRVPLLTDVIALTKGRAKLNIELKFNGHDEQLAQRVVDIVREMQVEDQCVISSLDQDGLKQVQEIAPEVRTGLITAVSIGNLAKTDADFLSVSQSHVSLSLVQSAHQRGKEVHVWTVNDMDTANRLIDMGVDNLLTDDPAMMVQLRNERTELTTAERLLLQSHRWLGN